MTLHVEDRSEIRIHIWLTGPQESKLEIAIRRLIDSRNGFIQRKLELSDGEHCLKYVMEQHSAAFVSQNAVMQKLSRDI